MIKSLFSKTVFWHIVAIAAFILYELRMVFFWGTNASVFDFIIFYLADITFFYLSTYWLLPNINNKQRYFISKVLMIAIWILLFSLVILGLIHLMSLTHGKGLVAETFMREYYRVFWRILYLFSLALGYWYARYSVKKEREAKENALLVSEAKEREMRLENALLRSQINPHLMFNTLSGISTQLFAKAPEAANLMVQLAEVMEYALDGSKSETKPTLRQELEHIRKLIELQRELHKDNLQLAFTVDVPESMMENTLPALLFINPVDNVFKHGVLNDRDRPVKIEFRCAADTGSLILFIQNAVAPVKRNVGKGGLGMENLRTRLDRHFPNKYKLETNMVNDTYSFTLTIDL